MPLLAYAPLALVVVAILISLVQVELEDQVVVLLQQIVVVVLLLVIVRELGLHLLDELQTPVKVQAPRLKLLNSRLVLFLHLLFYVLLYIALVVYRD